MNENKRFHSSWHISRLGYLHSRSRTCCFRSVPFRSCFPLLQSRIPKGTLPTFFSPFRSGRPPPPHGDGGEEDEEFPGHGHQYQDGGGDHDHDHRSRCGRRWNNVLGLGAGPSLDMATSRVSEDTLHVLHGGKGQDL